MCAVKGYSMLGVPLRCKSRPEAQVPEIALIVALHGVHAGGADFGWIGPLGISVLIIATLAISSRRAKK